MEEYFGFKEVTWSDDELATFYQDMSQNSVGCLVNEYLIINDGDGSVIDQYRWDGDAFLRVPFKQITSRFGGEIKPRNKQQQLAIDMLYNNEITVKVLAGKFGTGRFFAPLCGNA